jgi:glutamate racemase
MPKNLLGVFDSGVGGFSVLQEVRKATTSDILYFGDCARAPYGNRSEEQIVVFIKEALLRLIDRGVTHFVSACNSMSVYTTEKLLEEVGIPRGNYIDMVSAISGLEVEEGDKVLLLGTKVTIESGAYQTILRNRGIEVDSFIPRMLGGEIERGDEEGIQRSVSQAIGYAKAIHANRIVYACTHYPLVDHMFKEQAHAHGWTGIFVDPALYVAKNVLNWNLTGSGNTAFETTLQTDIFKEYSSKTW